MPWRATDRRPLFLVGMMGSGKSTVGRLLAQKLEVPFVDLDDRITVDAGASVAEIWSGEGEAGFRAREAEQVKRACGEGAQVVATGGGAPRFGDNLERMRAAGFLVWLDAALDQLAERVGSAPDRPLLVGRPTRDTLARLYEERRPFYSQAHLHIDTTGRPPSQVCEAILEAIK
jgi:shikimate kinase